MSNNRNTEIDIVRGLSILFVVALHISIPNVFWTNLLGSFHMVIFIFCSGYCFNNKHIAQKNAIWSMFIKKVKTLYLPFLLFNSVMILLNNLFIRLNIYTDEDIFIQADLGMANFYGLKWKINIYEMLHQIGGIILFGKYGETQLGGATWFLRVLFIITMIFFLIEWLIIKAFKEKAASIGKWIHLSLGTILCIVGWKGHELGCSNTYQYLTCCSIYFVYVLGYLVAKTDVLEVLKSSIFCAIVMLAISMFVLTLITPEASIAINANSYASIQHLVLCSIFGIIACFALASLVGKIRYLNKIFVVLGKNSLYIMMFHFLAFKIVTLAEVIYYREPYCFVASFPVLYTEGVWRILYLFVGNFVPVVVVVFGRKIKKKFVKLRYELLCRITKSKGNPYVQ